MVPNVDLTAQAPPARIPKLKYRNPLPPPSDNVSLASDSSQGSGFLSAYSQESPISPDSKPPSSFAHPSFETASVTSSSLASLSSSASSSNDSRSSTKKKKKGSVLGFLSLKEPSQVALQQFAEQQRKQASASGTSTPQSKASSYYAGQKLPRNVPKVNSKWDGVPDAVKHRYTTSGSSTKDKRSSIASKGSLGSPINNGRWNESRFSVMTDGTRNPPNSIASISIPDFAVHNGTSGLGSSPSTTTLPEITSYFPDGPVTSSHANSTAETDPQSSTRLSDATSSDRPSMDGSTNSRPHSPASSTTSTDTVVMDAADTIFRKLNDRPSQGSWGKNTHAVQPQDDAEPDFVPDSHDFLFRPQPASERRNSDSPVTYEPISPTSSIPHYAPVRPVQNFSRPMGSKGPPPVQRSAHMPPYRRTPSAPALPTLYEASLASTDDAEEHDADADSYSIAPSTIAPSELSKHWYESPRERLGLGRRLQINDSSPWDEQRGAAGKPKKSRLSMFGRTVSK